MLDRDDISQASLYDASTYGNGNIGVQKSEDIAVQSIPMVGPTIFLLPDDEKVIIDSNDNILGL